MNEEKKIVETPLMKQYFAIKAQHPDALLLFRVGDFYETFGEDAVTASKILGIVLTRRANGSASYVELAGFPHHSIESYLPRLVRAGCKVAVCDQLEDPKLTKKIVKRGITELVTPGVAYNDQILTHNENNFLASLAFDKDKAGIAFLDISTGLFRVASGSLSYIEILLSGFKPREILIPKSFKKGFEERFGTKYYISAADDWAFVQEAARDKLLNHFRLNTLKGFGIENIPLGITAAGAALFYLEVTHHEGLSHICSISRIDETDFVWIDKFTFDNLEIFSSDKEDAATLINIADHTSSPMGARLLKQWIAMPSKDIGEIVSRHNVVEYLVANEESRISFASSLGALGDIERIISKTAAGRVSPREVIQLKKGLAKTGEIALMCTEAPIQELSDCGQMLDPCTELLNRLEIELLPDAPGQAGKGDVIATGVNEELDELRRLALHGKEYLAEIQEREVVRTGISSLKISYNNVFGYYLEVRNTHKDKVPADWIRKQTLVSAERYITQELKEYEEKILGAEEKIMNLEQHLFSLIIDEIRHNIPVIQNNCRILSRLDVLNGFADLAVTGNYCRPEIDEGNILEIKNGRHPVIEKLMPAGEEYVANDLFLDDDNQQIIIVTGPNMAGKSALLRQTALIVLLAQAGSFVPAERARIGIVDKIFTRVGASDNISRGESTFMVEMLETAMILHNLSHKSLVLLDEIGRGTSTYDGMSIAWSIVEYLHERPGCRPKTLFATHYHELNELESKFERVKNFNISVKEVENKVIFLRKLVPGGVEHSFGIHVARMAGMPAEVIHRAERVLKRLEENRREGNSPDTRTALSKEPVQLSFFQLEDPLLTSIRDELRAMDLNTMSPLDAFDKLRLLKKKTGLPGEEK
jgi:DNA mismatch repair protein MutS